MNYVKKMCILRQIRQGFSGDGKALSGLIKIEQYGKNLAVEISVINFAPLVSGEYYCLLSDGKGKTEMLALRGKSLFNLLSDLDISGGFCGIICYIKNEVVPIAYGINGNKSYDWKTILNATLPPVFPSVRKETASGEIAGGAPLSRQENTLPAYETPPEPFPEPPTPPAPPAPNPPIPTPPAPAPEREEPIPLPPPAPTPPREDIERELPPTEIRAKKPAYDDENVATENYYEENKDERGSIQKAGKNAHAESAAEKQRTQARPRAEEDGDAPRVRQPFKTDPDGYYLSVKEELDGLFRRYPRDRRLAGAFSCSEWIRVKGTAKNPEYLVGVLRRDGRVQYICYALAAEDKNAPPAEIKNVCAFVPTSPYTEEGFFVIFQSAATGECVRPERA